MTPERIIVGIDGSEGSRGALEWTAPLAHALGAAVIAVHTYNPVDALEHANPPVDFAALRDETEQRAREEWCAPLLTTGVTFEVVLVDDDPVDGLLAAVALRDADLVVVGSHGHTGWRERILGTVTDGVIKRCSCPVVVVPPRSRD